MTVVSTTMGYLKRAAVGSNETACKCCVFCVHLLIQAYHSVVLNTSFI